MCVVLPDVNSFAMLSYKTLSFAALSVENLYQILRLRTEIFVVEQTCIYQDMDNKDQESYHLFATGGKGEVLSYARLVPPGVSYSDYASIGRVVVSQKARGTKEGYRLMAHAIEETVSLWPKTKIKISAQSHLENFYRKVGFLPTEERYLEDGIPHMAMVLKK